MKQIATLKDFSGGLNTADLLNSIEANECNKLDGLIIDSKYQLIMSPGYVDQNVIPSTHSMLVSSIKAGYGLFTFGSDNALTTSLSTSSSKAIYVIAGNSANLSLGIAELYDYDGNNGIVGSAIYGGSDTSYISVVSATGDFAPVFYYADGVLRICDANFSSNSSNKSVLYVGKTLFTNFHINSTNNGSQLISGWYSLGQYPSAPTAGIYSSGLFSTTISTTAGLSTTQLAVRFNPGGNSTWGSGNYVVLNESNTQMVMITGSSSTGVIEHQALIAETHDASDVYIIAPKFGKGFNVSTSAITGGFGIGSTIEMGQTFLYEDGQESQVYNMSGMNNLTLTTNNGLQIYVSAMAGFNPRISGGRLYIKKENTWYLLAGIDLKNGIYKTEATGYVGWRGYLSSGQTTLTGINDVIYTAGPLSVTDLSQETYETLNGFKSEDILTPKYKTAVVTNRRTYVGNVELSTGVTEPDAVYKSIPNKFDTFTKNGILEVVNDDGESVVKLNAFNDRLFEFKEKTLYIINIATDVEYLEGTHPGLGINKPFHSITTEYGVAFINRNGVYLHDGQRYLNLLLKKDQTGYKIKLSDWTSFYDKDKSLIGYEPLGHKIYIIDDCESTGAQNTWFFDIVNYTWSRLTDYPQSGVNPITNSVVDFNGKSLIFSSTSSDLFRVSTSSVANTSVTYRTKFMDFNRPDTNKVLHKVIIRHANAGANKVKVKYYADSATQRSFSSSYLSNNASLTEEEFTPATDSERRNKKFFAVELTTTGISVGASFTVQEIKFIFREKTDR